MKGRGMLLALGVFLVGMINVNASNVLEVKDVDELKSCFLVSDNTCKLVSDLELSQSIKISSSTITLDLNGHTINGKDNNNGNFALFDISKGIFNVKDSAKNGTITLASSINRGWNAQSTIIENRGGVVNIYGGTLKNLGITDMAYVVNVNTNSVSSATLNVYGGTLESTYTAIRLYMSKSGTCYLNVYDGNILATKRAIWAQAPESNTKQTSEIKITNGNVGFIKLASGTNIDVSTVISGGTFEIDPSDYLVDEDVITATITSGDVVKYIVGADNVKNVVSNAAKGDLITVDGNIEFSGVASGVTLKAVNSSKVIANGITVTKEGITIETTTEVDVDKLNTKEEVKEVTLGVVNTNKFTDIINKTLEKLLNSDSNSNLADIISNNDTKVSIDIQKIEKNNINHSILKAMKLKSGNGTIASYFDISLLIKNAKDNSSIGLLNELTDDIELTILLPNNLVNNNKNSFRKYYIIREHEGKVEKISASLSEDGKTLTFKTNKFSTYALGYEDVDQTITNPSTFDGIIMYVVMSVVSVAGIIATILISKRKKLNY